MAAFSGGQARSVKTLKGGRGPSEENGLDVATAAVWAYEHGYLRLLLSGPSLSERLAQLSAELQLPSCRQLLLLCPSDGQPTELDDRLVSVGRAATFCQSVAGARSREYGGHTVYRLDGAGRLAAVESIGSLHTLHVVADATARSPRRLPPLDAARLAGQFVTRLRDTVTRDARLRDAFRLVEYDPSRPGALEAALEAAAVRDTSDAEDPPPTPVGPPSPPLPGGVGVYLAWSFVHGYLALTAGERDVTGELSRLRRDAALPLELARVVVLCPTSVDWSDISSLDGRLEPVYDVDGVKAGQAGRQYGSFSIYSSRQEDGGGCFALELATPLRTLRLGVSAAGLGRQVYQREAVSFAKELRTLLAETPALAAHYAVLQVDPQSQLLSQLHALTTEAA